MNCRASSSLNGYSMQWISCLRSNNANRQRPKPARIVPFVVIRIGSGTDCSFSRAASLNSSITPVQPSSSSARCSCLFWRTNDRTPLQPTHRSRIERLRRRRDRRDKLDGDRAATVVEIVRQFSRTPTLRSVPVHNTPHNRSMSLAVFTVPARALLVLLSR